MMVLDVNLNVHPVNAPPLPPTMIGVMAQDNIVERIRTLIHQSGRFSSEREFLRRCNISSGYLGNVAKRLASNPETTITLDKARVMAQQLGISTDELLHGQKATERDASYRYAGQQLAAEAARKLEFPEAVIASVLLEDPGFDPGKMYWFHRMEAVMLTGGPASQTGSRLKR